MEEFELRFRISNRDDLVKKLSSLNFVKKNSIDMADLLFPVHKLEKVGPGSTVIRIRLTSDDKPKLETKTMINLDRWDEHSLKIEDACTMFKILSKINSLSMVISKKRETWVLGDIIVTLDNVKHLGEFTEVEGPEEKVLKIIEKLGFKFQNKQKPYGWLLSALEKEGKKMNYKKEALEFLEKFKS